MLLHRSLIAGAIVMLIGVAVTPSDLFAATLDGQWSGSGYVVPTSGKREKVRCRVTYNRQGERTYGVVAVCASASVTVRQTGQLLMVDQSRYVGDFHNAQYSISGRVRVRVSGGTQTVTFESANGTGQLTLRRR